MPSPKPTVLPTDWLPLLRMISRVWNGLIYGQYLASDPAPLTDGKYVVPRTDVLARLLVTIGAAITTWVPATAAAPADSGVIRNVATNVYKVLAVNTHATITYYLMLFDLAAVPANGTAPRLPAIPIAPGQTILLDFGTQPLVCANGFVWSDSTTIATKTIAATTPFQVSAEVT